jgi:5,6-dimethylbenzimidazole synthase
MDLYDAIKRRRDVRVGYRQDPIPPPVLAKVLMAAHMAPSVGFSQPWNFILIRDKERRARVKKLVEEQREEFRRLLPPERREVFDRIKVEAILDTPLNIAVTCDPSRFGPHVLGRLTQPETCQYSAVLAVGNLWLAARAEGIGVGWVSFFRKEQVKEILKIPEDVDLVAYLTLGYVDRFPERPELEERGWLNRLPLTEVVFQEEWGGEVKGELLRELKEIRI